MSSYYQYETRLITLPITTAVGRRDMHAVEHNPPRLGPWPLKRGTSAPGRLHLLQESNTAAAANLGQFLSQIDEECAVIDNISSSPFSASNDDRDDDHDDSARSSKICAACHQSKSRGHVAAIQAAPQRPRTHPAVPITCFIAGLLLLWIPPVVVASLESAGPSREGTVWMFCAVNVLVMLLMSMAFLGEFSRRWRR